MDEDKLKCFLTSNRKADLHLAIHSFGPRLTRLVRRRMPIEQRFGDVDREEAEIFVREGLAKNGFAILRKYNPRHQATVFLTTACANLLVDWKRSKRGRFYVPAAIEKKGPLAVRIFTLTRKEGRSIAEVEDMLVADGSVETPGQAESLVDEVEMISNRSDTRGAIRLRDGRGMPIEGDGHGEPVAVPAPESVRPDQAFLSGEVCVSFEKTWGELTSEERTIIGLLFVDGRSKADAARVLKTSAYFVEKALDGILDRFRQIIDGLDSSTIQGLCGDDVIGFLGMNASSGDRTRDGPESDF